MPVLSDKWITRMAKDKGMISPFEEKQVRGNSISYGVSSYGYDARVADEFKIFTNVNTEIVDPKNFKPTSFISKKGKECIIPPNSFVLASTVEYFKVPEDVVEELKNNAYQNKYLPMQGLSELRQSVAKYTSKKKNYEYNSENVIIGPGSKELMFLLHVIFDGEIILPAPSWVSYAPQAILGRNKIQILQTKRENNWFPTAQEIEEVILKDRNKNYGKMV